MKNLELKKIDLQKDCDDVIVAREAIKAYDDKKMEIIDDFKRIGHIREVASSIPVDYLKKIQFVGADDLRRLLIKGCEVEMNELNNKMIEISENLNKNIDIKIKK